MTVRNLYHALPRDNSQHLLYLKLCCFYLGLAVGSFVKMSLVPRHPTDARQEMDRLQVISWALLAPIQIATNHCVFVDDGHQTDAIQHQQNFLKSEINPSKYHISFYPMRLSLKSARYKLPEQGAMRVNERTTLAAGQI